MKFFRLPTDDMRLLFSKSEHLKFREELIGSTRMQLRVMHLTLIIVLCHLTVSLIRLSHMSFLEMVRFVNPELKTAPAQVKGKSSMEYTIILSFHSSSN